MSIKALLVCIAMALTGTVFGQAAAAQSSVNLLQEDVVDEVNTSQRTLVIGGETFQVDSTAGLEDAEGRRISIGEIRATQNHGEGDLVEYALVGRGDVRTDSGLRSIESLRVLGADYE